MSDTSFGAGKDLDTVQWLLRRVKRQAVRQPQFAPAADHILGTVGDAVKQQYGGFIRLLTVFDPPA
jgi:hypothetical protein